MVPAFSFRGRTEAGQTDIRRICGTNMKHEFYYQQMNKAQQSAYRAMLGGFESLSPEAV